MENHNPLVSIIVVNHNGKIFLPDFFESVFNQTCKDAEVIMVDNNSSDDSIQFVSENYPAVKVIANKENSGYATGNNLGFKEAKGEYMVIVNNDVILQKDLIEKLLKSFIEIPNLGAVQPMIKLMNSQNSLDACGSFWTNTGFNYHYGIYKNANLPIYNRSFPIYSLKGVCMMIPRKVIEKIGLFDDDFWCYFEETDFCHRVWLAGYECWYYPKSFIYHCMGGTRLKKSEAFVQFHSFKNRLCSYLKNLGTVEIIKIFPVYFSLNFLWSVYYLATFNFDNLTIIYKAIWWNIKNLKKTLIKRKNVQKNIRIMSDQEIFSKVRVNPRITYYYYLIKGLSKYVD